MKTPQYDARHAWVTVVQGQEVIERSGQRVVVVDAIDVELCDPDWQPGAGDDVKPMLRDVFINNYACEYAPPSVRPGEPDFRDVFFFNSIEKLEEHLILRLVPACARP